MRISSNFGERSKPSNALETRKKVFFVFEGDKTEYQYFNGLINYREQLNISSCYDFKSIVRSFDEQGWSNPKKILERFLYQAEQKSLTFDVLKELICDYFISNKIIDAEASYLQTSINRAFDTIFNLRSEDVVDIEKETEKLEKALVQIYTGEIVLESILKFVQDSKVVYEKEIDIVCLIVDRDKKSFICRKNNNQYKYVVGKCKENSIDLYITNPCFEFWLYLHYDNGKGLEHTKLLENERDGETGETYIEQELKKYLPDYKKNNLNFEEFKDRIENAILYADTYSVEIEGIKNSCGTNLHQLVEKLRK